MYNNAVLEMRPILCFTHLFKVIQILYRPLHSIRKTEDRPLAVAQWSEQIINIE